MASFNNGMNYYPGNNYNNFNNYNGNNFNSMNTYTYVKGLDGAKNYQIGANQTVLLIDTDNSVLYVKTANALGQVSLQYFSITPITEADVTAKVSPTAAANYVSKDDYNALLKRVETLEFKRGIVKSSAVQAEVVNNG